jgi:low affinity Fe/Cu permease
MASLASINIRFAVDLREFSTEMQNSLRTIDKVGQKFQAVGRNLSAYVTLPILAAGAAAVKFASDYNESLNKVDVAFKSSSTQVKEFSKTSLESFGIAEGTALDMAAAYGDMGTSMGLTTGQAAKMSTSLVGLAGDLASFKNISIDIANTAISAIFTGETESLKKMGIVMTEVNLQNYAYSKGIKTKIADMGQAEKVQLRYNYILSVTKNAQGDFERTQGGAANQTRIFTESLKQVGQQLGVVVLPLFTKLITAVNEKIKAFSNLSEGTKKTIVVIAGLVAVIGPLVLVIGVVLSAIPAIVAGFALVSAAIVPVLAGVVLLIGVMMVLKNATTEAAASQDSLNEAIRKGDKVSANEIVALDKLYATAKNVKLSIDERKQAVEELQALYPAYFKNIDAESLKNGIAEKSYRDLREAIFNKSRAVAVDGEIQKRANERISKELVLRDKIAATEKEITRLNNLGGDVVIRGNRAEKELDVVLKKSDLIKAQTKLLGLQNDDLKKFNKEALDADSVLYKAKLDYSSKIGKLKENEDLVKKNDENVTPGVLAPSKEKKIKAPKNIDPVNNEIVNRLSTGSISAYDAEIAKLKEFRDQVGLTAVQIKAADDAIAKVEFAKSLKFDPTSLIKISGGFEKLQTEMEARAGGYKAVADSIKSTMLDLSTVLGQTVTDLAVNVTASFGEAIGGLIVGTASIGDVIAGMLGMIAGFMSDLGKQLIALGIAKIAFDKIAISGIGAVIAGTALVALAAIVKGTLGKGPKTQAFAKGGIVGGASFYGDKILARVNSGEMIANSDQQRKIYNAMSAANSQSVNVTLGGGFELDGNKLRLVLDRTDKRKNRIG